MLPRWATLTIALFVAAIWGVTVVVGLYDPTRANPYVSAIFGGIVAAVFGLDRAAKRTRNVPPGSEAAPVDRGDQA